MAQYSKTGICEAFIRGFLAANNRAPTLDEITLKLCADKTYPLYSDGTTNQYTEEEARGYYIWWCKRIKDQNGNFLKPILPARKKAAKAHTAPKTNEDALSMMIAAGLIDAPAQEQTEEQAA